MANDKNNGLKSGAFTGSKEAGNPYDGDLGKGIAYDTYEANTSTIVQENNFPEVHPVYRAGAKKLVRYLSSGQKETLLDLGSGTGICTLELLCQHPESRAIGIEISEGMMNVAKYKFHQEDSKELLAHTDSTQLVAYWKQFRKESLPYAHKVKFIGGDVQESDLLIPESIDGAVANQVIHWTDISKTFANFQKWLKPKGEVIWNSASHWYNDEQFPALEYSFRFNDFLKYVVREVSKDLEVKDIYTLPTPKQNLESIKTASAEHGLQTEQVGTYLIPVDLQTFVQNHVPIIVKNLIRDCGNCGDDYIKSVISQAIGDTIRNPKALGDIKHKYDIVPVLRTVKK